MVAEIEELVETDKAQFVFQEEIQIEQAILRVATLLWDTIQFILVLDLAKAYDTVLKTLLIEKLEQVLPRNLVCQLKVFITTVKTRVSGDITKHLSPCVEGCHKGGHQSVHKRSTQCAESKAKTEIPKLDNT